MEQLATFGDQCKHDNTFKSRLELFFWANKELIYRYKSTLTVPDNRSFVEYIDNTIFQFHQKPV